MEYKFSDRVLTLKPSAIREIFKYAADPSYISLSAGNPAPEAFPSKQLAAISAKLMEEEPILALQYSTTEGYPPLLQHLKAYMKSSRNIGTEDDGVLVTSGAQQIMDLFTKSILNEGETVICEAPSFIGSLNDFRSYKAKLVGIPMDTDGMNMEALEKALETEKNVKFIYTIPNFQNPSGITMSLEKRHRLYELAKAHDVMILEDNPYGDLYYEGEPLPSIKSFDTDGIVIYAGSFSKVISPGMRVGYAIGPKPVLAKMTVCKQGQDVHTNIWSQVLCYRFMTEYDFDAHLAGLRKIYTKKRALLLDLMEKHLAPYITWDTLTGMFALGNYLGALKNFVALQNDYECVYALADLHAITVRQNPAEFRKNTLSAYAMMLALGIDPEKSIFFIQSQVPEHAQLAWVLSCYTQFGELSRMTQFKDKSAKHADNVNAGLFTYPSLMAADILLYNADYVPVGADQKQHLELCRNIAERFNGLYSPTFVVPDGLIPKTGARIMSLQDPTKKMSKSDENTAGFITMLDTPAEIMKKFKRAVTDSEARVYYGENKAGINNLMGIYSCITGKSYDEIEKEFEGRGYGDFKTAVGEAVVKELEPIQARYNELIKDKAYLEKCYSEAAPRAEAIARRTLQKVMKKVGYLPVAH